jgi:serine/threonine protein kinase
MSDGGAAGRVASPSARQLPKSIGGYRIVDRIGKGAMGVVYSALDEQNARRVAIKVMMTDLEGDPETRERFYREAKIAGRLQHRNLISVYDMGEEDGRLYMVMELLKGDTLNDYLKRVHTLSLEATLDFMSQMCEGLAVAHVHGIFHRDIKPGNIFVQEDGSLKVLDFGVARLADSNMTASGFIVGTPDFMSPEQARGAEIDHRSDIFSTGAVFYYMLSGRKPFAATDLPAVLHKVEAEDPVPLTDREAPTGLWKIVAKALAKSVTRRYQELGELLTDLTHFQRDYDRQSRENTTGSRGRRRLPFAHGCSPCSVPCRSVRTRDRAPPTRISSALRFASGTRCSKTRGPMRSASFRSGVRRCTRSKRKSNAVCRCSRATPRGPVAPQLPEWAYEPDPAGGSDPAGG